MSQNVNTQRYQIGAVAASIAREVERIEQERTSLQKMLAKSSGSVRQIKDLVHLDPVFSQVAKELASVQTATSLLGQQYRQFLTVASPAAQAIKEWQDSQRAQHEHIRKMLEPLADMRKSFLLHGDSQQLIKTASSAGEHLRKMLDRDSGIGSAAKVLAQQLEVARAQTQSVFEKIQVSASVRSILKDFERVNNQWQVPNEVVRTIGALNALQVQVGKLNLPTIDIGSAAALANLLGKEGLEEQLAYLGIDPDGRLQELKDVPEKGLLSRKQSDAVALLGLLLAIVSIWMTIQIFYYQESSGAQQQNKNDEQSAKQLRQLESLGRLIEQTLVQSSKTNEERFVVRGRTATVRSRPMHGAPVEGKLLPNEVVRVIDKDGMWIEVEYYHWLHEEYRTGWALKKYFERVPQNYFNTAKSEEKDASH